MGNAWVYTRLHLIRLLSPIVFSMAERFKLTYVERDAKLAPKRARNGGQHRRLAESSIRLGIQEQRWLPSPHRQASPYKVIASSNYFSVKFVILAANYLVKHVTFFLVLSLRVLLLGNNILNCMNRTANFLHSLNVISRIVIYEHLQQYCICILASNLLNINSWSHPKLH